MVALHATHLLTCHVAGTGHHCSPAIALDLRLGMSLNLVREPANDHDPDAIAVQLDISGSATSPDATTRYWPAYSTPGRP